MASRFSTSCRVWQEPGRRHPPHRPSEPTHGQRVTIERLCGLDERIVVMSETASTRLIDCYGVDPSRISVIAHGANPEFGGPSLVKGNRPLILTWGLIGPGKGLEWAIEGLANIVDMKPLPRYLIAGATHPNVRQETGETYRESLIALTARWGLGPGLNRPTVLRDAPAPMGNAHA